MVTITDTNNGPAYTTLNRGFLPEETVVAAGPGGNAITMYRPFWRPVVAGTLFALSVFVLSWYLMLGCHVGIGAGGVVALGIGAAIWLWVTSCIAYFFGGLIASAMTAPANGAISTSSGWLKGAVLWAFSIPAAIVTYGFAAQNGLLLMDLNMPRADSAATMVTTSGYHWAVFIGLGLALIFALIGGAAGCSCRSNEARAF